VGWTADPHRDRELAGGVTGGRRGQ